MPLPNGFISDEELEAQATPPGFISDEELEAQIPIQRTLKNPAESVVSGAADMLTLGHSDELGAAMSAGAGGLGSLVTGGAPSMDEMSAAYNGFLNDQREHKAQAAEDNPWSYRGGQVLGSVIPAVASGGATAGLNGVGRLGAQSAFKAIMPAAGRGVASNLARAGAGGAIMGSGASNARPWDSADKAEEYARDVGQGAVLGAGTTALFGAGAATARGIANKVRPTNVGAMMLGVPTEAAETYLQNPGAVNGAPKTADVMASFRNSMDDLQGQIVGGSQQSRAALSEEGKRFTGDQIAEIAKRHRMALVARGEGVLDEEAAKAAAWLKSIEDKFATPTTDSDLVRALVRESNGALTPDQAAKALRQEAEKNLSSGRLKDLVMDVRSKLRPGGQPPEMTPAGSSSKAAFANDVDQMVRGSSPEYVRQMSNVAADEGLHAEVSNLARNPQQIENLLKRAQRDPAQAKYATRVIAEFDKRMGTNYLEQLRMGSVRNAFERGAGGPGGSHMATMYGDIGAAMGGIKGGPVAARVGRALGSMTGGAVNKSGPAMGKSILDTTIRVKQMLNNSQAIQRLGRFAPILKAAMARGPAVFAATNTALMRDPEYRDIVSPVAEETPRALP